MALGVRHEKEREALRDGELYHRHSGGHGQRQTTLTKRLKERFGDDVSVISHDNYYKRHDELP